MRVTVSDIAKRAGVSQGTVSFVLNKKATAMKISEATKTRVLQVVEEMGYRPSYYARSLAKGKTSTLGFICGDIDTPYLSEVASCALVEAEKNGYRLLVSITEWNSKKEMDHLEKMLLQRQVDGIMITSNALKPGVEQYEYLLKHQMPVVTLGPYTKGLVNVQADYRPGMDHAVDYLKQKGHSRIGFVDMVDFEEAISFKRTSFLEACRKHGVESREYEIAHDIQDARRLGQTVMPGDHDPRSFIIYSDYFATGFMAGLYDKGMRVPQDVAVIGIDGTRMGAYYCPPLTSIGGEIKTIAVESVKLLLAMIEGKEIPSRQIMAPTGLIVRQSA